VAPFAALVEIVLGTMLFSCKPIREILALFFNGETELPPMVAISGGGAASAEGLLARTAGDGNSRWRGGGSPENPGAKGVEGGKAGGTGKNPGPTGNDAEPAPEDDENDENPQHLTDDRVDEDMATLVLDSPGLGRTPATAPGEPPELLAGQVGSAAADPSSDAAIMLRVAAGDEAGFNYLVGKYHRSMINFLYRMVHNQAVAEELAQEVFLRVYRSRESYRAEAKFTTWLYRIATNLAVNHARDTKHERAAQNVYLDVPDEETGTTPEVADDDPNVEQRMLRDERMAGIRKHVMALPERQRTAVLMHKYQGLDYRQIGEVLKLSESATKSLLFRAYQTLRDRLKDFV
jgi:RNA polymerase sigma-70 factor (ECF subfamily)